MTFIMFDRSLRSHDAGFSSRPPWPGTVPQSIPPRPGNAGRPSPQCRRMRAKHGHFRPSISAKYQKRPELPAGPRNGPLSAEGGRPFRGLSRSPYHSAPRPREEVRGAGGGGVEEVVVLAMRERVIFSSASAPICIHAPTTRFLSRRPTVLWGPCEPTRRGAANGPDAADCIPGCAHSAAHQAAVRFTAPDPGRWPTLSAAASPFPMPSPPHQIIGPGRVRRYAAPVAAASRRSSCSP